MSGDTFGSHSLESVLLASSGERPALLNGPQCTGQLPKTGSSGPKYRRCRGRGTLPSRMGDREGAPASLSLKADKNPAPPTRHGSAAAAVPWLTPHQVQTLSLTSSATEAGTHNACFLDSSAARGGRVTPSRPMRRREKSTQSFGGSVWFPDQRHRGWPGHYPLFFPPEA